MKKIFFSICVIAMLTGINSCNNDPIDGENSIYDDTIEFQKNEFDEWIYENYTKGYNVNLKYRLDYKESDMQYNLLPADFGKSVILAQVIQKVWLEAYDEMAGPNFLKQYVPRVIHFIGSKAYKEDGSVVLGVAEGGNKITLYDLNSLSKPLNPNILSGYYHVMHHEFAHILHQTRNYSELFVQISKEDYVTDDWTKYTDASALALGIISAYARSNPDEDFVETYSFYINNPQSWWDNKLNQAGEKGAEKLRDKLAIIKEYFKTEWNIDLDEFRIILARRGQEVLKMELLEFSEVPTP